MERRPIENKYFFRETEAVRKEEYEREAEEERCPVRERERERLI